MKKETTWQELEKYILNNCKVNDNLLAVNFQELLKKFGTTKQNLHGKLNRIISHNQKLKKVGEYLMIKIK